MFTSLFWKDMGERALATAVQVLIAIVVADKFNWFTADWANIGETIGIAVALVVLKSLAAVLPNVPTISPASLARDKRGA